MAIRKRITSAVKLNEDQALRTALRIAITNIETRNSTLEESIREGISFDADEDQQEIDKNRRLLATWHRWANLPGSVTLSNDEA